MTGKPRGDSTYQLPATPQIDETGTFTGYSYGTRTITARGNVKEELTDLNPSGEVVGRRTVHSGKDEKGHQRLDTTYMTPDGQWKLTETSEKWSKGGHKFERVVHVGPEGRLTETKEVWRDSFGQPHEKTTQRYQWRTEDGDFDSVSDTHSWRSKSGESHNDVSDRTLLRDANGKVRVLDPHDPRIETGRSGGSGVDPDKTDDDSDKTDDVNPAPSPNPLPPPPPPPSPPHSQFPDDDDGDGVVAAGGRGDGVDTPDPPDDGDSDDLPDPPDDGDGVVAAGGRGDGVDTPDPPDDGDSDDLPDPPDDGDGVVAAGGRGDGVDTPDPPDDGDSDDLPDPPDDGDGVVAAGGQEDSSDAHGYDLYD